jgi:hypothetical protein
VTATTESTGKEGKRLTVMSTTESTGNKVTRKNSPSIDGSNDAVEDANVMKPKKMQKERKIRFSNNSKT